MKYFLLFSILFTTLLQANQKEVLLIHSYHKGYAWADDISKAIEKNFSKTILNARDEPFIFFISSFIIS